MDNNAANPVIIGFLFVVRCLVPLLLMLGISYVLRRLGLIKEPPAAPNGTGSNGVNPNGTEGDLLHGKV